MSDSERDHTDRAEDLLEALYPSREDVIPGYHLWRLVREPGRVLFLYDPALPAAATALVDCASRELMRRLASTESWTVRVYPSPGETAESLRGRIVAAVIPDVRGDLREESLDVVEGDVVTIAVGAAVRTCVLDGAAAARFRRGSTRNLPGGADARAWVSFWSMDDWDALDGSARRAVLGAHDRVCSSDARHPWRLITAEAALQRPARPQTMMVTDVCQMRGWFAWPAAAKAPESIRGRPDGRLRHQYRSPAPVSAVAYGVPLAPVPLDELIGVHLRSNAHFSEIDVGERAQIVGGLRLRRWDLDPRVVIIEAEWSSLEFGESDAVLGRLDEGAIVVDARSEPVFVKLSGPRGQWFIEVRGAAVSVYEMEESAVDRR
jgi:hypothetical protein